jgi:hypothetical protein
MIYFLKLYYNIFILDNKIDAPVFKIFFVNLFYIMLEILLIYINMKRVSF